MDFLTPVNNYARTMNKGVPPIAVMHPSFGRLGDCTPKGFVPVRGRWASANAIMRDHNRKVVKTLRHMEDNAPSYAAAAIAALLARDPSLLPMVMSAISTYDGIVAARGSGAMQDVWLALTANMTPVSAAWHDTWKMAMTPGTVPSVTAFSAGTGGAVLDATSNGSWLANPGGTNKKYIVSCGLTTTSVGGASLALLVDNLWAGSESITSATTITATSSVPVTRYAGAAAAGNQLSMTLTATLTYSSGTPTLTFTYMDQGGNETRTGITVLPATGPLTNRVVGNTAHNAATVVSSPFMPLTNAGSTGVRALKATSWNTITITSGSVDIKIVRPLVMMPFIAASSYIEQDTTLNIGNMVELATVSQVCGCLSWYVLGGGTTAFTFGSMLRTVEG